VQAKSLSVQIGLSAIASLVLLGAALLVASPTPAGAHHNRAYIAQEKAES